MTLPSTPLRRLAAVPGRAALLGSLGLLASCATPPSAQELDAQFATLMQASFRSEGIASVDRLTQDEAQRLCSTGRPPDEASAQRLRDAAQASIQPPPDGRYLGDWKEGEKLAQSGRGMTWTDKSAAPGANGGSCYNCHQISKSELSYGTIGPSLLQYGLRRGVSNPADPAAAPIVQYTWGKLYNSAASNACSNMPRFGHRGLLDATQMQHLMALLLDPQSPVNAP